MKVFGAIALFFAISYNSQNSHGSAATASSDVNESDLKINLNINVNGLDKGNVVPDQCYFQYWFASLMVPCCLNIISREEYDRLVEENAKNSMVGGAFGKHHYCPKNAEEAHQILSGRQQIESRDSRTVLPWCVQIITGNNERPCCNQGYLKVDINNQNEPYKKPLTWYHLKEEVVNKCFSRLDSIILTSDGKINGWAGQIIVKKDGVKRDLICIEGCTNEMKLNDNWIDVDGDASKPHTPNAAKCLNGSTCKIVPEKTEWSEWSPCSESCGTGFKVRARAKIVVESGARTSTTEEKDTEQCLERNNNCEPISE